MTPLRVGGPPFRRRRPHTREGKRSGAETRARWRLVAALLLTSRAATAWAGGQAPPPLTYVYDANGRLVAVVDASQDGSGGGTAIYSYDGAGNLLSITRQTTTTLSVLAFTPQCGASGEQVTIYGTGFSTTATANTVNFPGGSAPASSATATQLLVTVPPSAAGSGKITATVSGATSPQSLQTFTVGCGAPTISDFTTSTCANPNLTCSASRSCCIGTVGTGVTITGTNFDTNAANDRLTFHHSRLTSVGSPTSTQIVTAAPLGVTSGRLQLVTPKGVASSSLDFFAPPPNYSVTQIDPAQAVRLSNPNSGMSQTLTMPTVDATGNARIGLALFDAAQGDTPCWSVDASALTPPSGSPNPGYVNLALYDPDGIQSPINGGIGAGSKVTVRTSYYGRPLAATGTYTLVTVPNANTSGSLSLTPYNSHATIRNAHPTLTGAPPIFVSTTGPCQETWLRFSEALGHRFSAIVTNASPSNFSYTLDFWDGVASTVTGFGSQNCVRIDQALAAGPYQLQFTGNDPGLPTGSVTLTLYDVTDEISPVTIDPSSHQGSVRLYIKAPGEQPSAQFVSATNKVTIQMSNSTSTNGFGISGSSLTLYDSTGTPVPNGSTNGNTLQVSGLTSGATYRVTLRWGIVYSCPVGYADLTITNS